jgi:hypothetical protein
MPEKRETEKEERRHGTATPHPAATPSTASAPHLQQPSPAADTGLTSGHNHLWPAALPRRLANPPSQIEEVGRRLGHPSSLPIEQFFFDRGDQHPHP